MKSHYRMAAIPMLALCIAVPASAARHHKPMKAPGPVIAANELTAPPPAPAEKPSLTLAEALAIAYETNPQLAAQQASLRATDENVAIANGGWRPTISAGGTYAYDQYYFNPVAVPGIGNISTISAHPAQAAITVTQPIFRGGRTYAQIGRAKAQVRSARAQLIAAEQTVLLSAATSYMDVVRDTQVLRLREHNVQVLQKQADATQAQFNAGSLTRTDVAQAQARLAGAQSDLTAAQSQLATSNANFVQAIGRMPETLEAEPALPPALPTGVDDSITLALKQNPAIVQARENEIVADYSVDDAIGAMLPTLSVQGQYGVSQGSLISPFGTTQLGGGTTSHALTVTGQLNVPIYQAGVEEATLRQAKELHAQSQLNVAVSDRQVRDAVAVAWAAFEAAEASIASNEAAVRANEIAFEGVSKEQQVGGRTILDVLNAEQELLNSSVALVTAKRTAEVAAFQVLAAAGTLTAQNLGLKVKLYDPQEHYDNDAAAWVGFGD
ncbi:MAG TPA: TolC family outer membrane protein [Rhizomicrobium sp.]|jgi:outer membrane protein|nr:TolC family outer membrane protein [Rhizomicrobium sp.]